MELEDMKTAWKELDTRLGKQEMFSENFIRETIADRSQRSVDKLLKVEITLTVIQALMLPLLMWLYSVMVSLNIPMTGFYLVTIISGAVIVVWQIVKITGLFGVDMSGDVKDNIRRITRYVLFLEFEKKSLWLLVPFMTVIVVVTFVAQGMPLWFWGLAACIVVIGVLGGLYYHKNVYLKNMAQIKKGLSELKDLQDKES